MRVDGGGGGVPLADVSAKDREQFATLEMSDGAMRPWFLRDEDKRRSFVYVGAVALGNGRDYWFEDGV